MTQLRLALPSNGALAESAEEFMGSCGLQLRRASRRRYTATIPSMPEVAVFFQRASDITTAVDHRGPDIGIVGLDQYMEEAPNSRDTVVLYELGFGRSRVVFAVPEDRPDWAKVDSVAALVEKLRSRDPDNGGPVQIATKYPRLVTGFLEADSQSVPAENYRLLYIRGALEAAPSMGAADLIADIAETGATLRENRLVPLEDEPICSSQAVLIANVRSLAANARKERLTRDILERMEAYVGALPFLNITANFYLDRDGLPNSPDSVAKLVASDPRFAGKLGPTVTRVFPKAPSDDEERQFIKDPTRWYSVQIVVRSDDLVDAVNHLRNTGGSAIMVSDVSFIFDPRNGEDRLARELRRFRSGEA